MTRRDHPSGPGPKAKLVARGARWWSGKLGPEAVAVDPVTGLPYATDPASGRLTPLYPAELAAALAAPMALPVGSQDMAEALGGRALNEPQAGAMPPQAGGLERPLDDLLGGYLAALGGNIPGDEEG